jgi:NAD(P)-dependent dehydrogenase (short-subunit alcohol dehydrogenase family)
MFLEKYQLTGKTAFITGGGRGIGLSSAEALAEAGARVIISDMNAEVLEAGQREMTEKGYNVDSLVLDVTDSGAVGAAAKAMNEKYGAVDILIANAGIAWPDTGGEEMTDDIWLKVVDVDLNGAFWSCREFGRFMLERGTGSIVTLGSMSGLISNKPQRQVHYNSAKAAVHHMTRSLAAEWAERGVRVNCVAPTYVDTAMSRGGFTEADRMPIWMDMTPMRRYARADEIASPILFLASDASSAMTGSIVVVDCGYTIW